MNDLNEASMIDTSLDSTTALEGTYHDLSTSSRGLIVDTQNGGLRTDLTHALSQGSLGVNFKGNPIIPEITPNGFTQNISPRNAPTWEVLESFYNLSLSASSGTPVELKAATDTEMGISPIILQNRIVISFYSEHNGLGKPDSSFDFYLQALPLFILANPYTFPIKASNGVEFSYGITTNVPDQSEWGVSIFRRAGNSEDQHPTFNINRFATGKYQYQDKGKDTEEYFPILANTKQHGSTDAVLNNVRFKTPTFTLQPGETIAFSMDGTQLGGVGNPGGIVNLKDSVDPSAYYRYALNTSANPFPEWNSSGNTRYNYLISMLTAEAMTLQMALPGSDPADGALEQPQVGVLQAIVNADLSAANAEGISSGTGYSYRLPPYPGSLSTSPPANQYSTGSNPQPENYITYQPPSSNDDATKPFSANPVNLSGYATWLTLPYEDSTLYQYDSFSQELTGNFRSYADFNLTARNFLMPPAAPLLIHATDQNNTFETVPPFARKFLRGPANTVGTGTGTTVDVSLWAENSLDPKWGSTTDIYGQKETVLYDVPHRASNNEQSFFSIGQLQHADLTGDDDFTSISYQPRYAVGNSWSSPFVKRANSIENLTRQSPTRVGNQDLAGNSSTTTGDMVRMFDLSYILNIALWDRYFFSSIIQNGAEAGTPANQRMTFAEEMNFPAIQLGIGQGDSPITDSSNGTTLLPEKAAARYMMIKGAFNINSTSVEAWKAILAGTRGLGLNGDIEGTPLPRSLNQTLDSRNAEDGDTDQTYAGYRRLTDNQIDTLAQNIVTEVKARGPFLSLGHFINRALSNDALGSKGALQSAIDNSTTINPFQNANDTAKYFSIPYKNNGSTSDIGYRATAAPGWLTQADILQSIGSYITARSDTFKIRAYGETLDPITDKVTSRVWCEATIQRQPIYVDNSISAANPPTNARNQNFGRQFKIIDFRWLDSDEI